MSFNILPTPPFERELKKLSKKYPSLKSDFSELISSLIENPTIGKPLGNIVIKFAWQFLLRRKESAAEPE